MKYFTPELYLRLQNLDQELMDDGTDETLSTLYAAQEEWERCLKAYCEEMKMFPPMLKPLADINLHDGRFVRIEETIGKGVSKADSVRLFVKLYGNDLPTVITYRDGKLTREEKIAGWTFGDASCVETMYDEVSKADSRWEHHILLSTGEILVIEFSTCEVK